MTPEDKRLIGASDVAAVLQVSDWSGWVSLWARCTGRWDWGGNETTRRGNLSEAYHRAQYAEDTGFTLLGPPAESLRHPLLPWARCSPDDTALTPDGRRGVELKQSFRDEGWGSSGREGVPEPYWFQVQMQGGLCSEVGYWDSADVDVSVLLFGRRQSYPVAHLPEAWERIQEACGRFWRDFVVADRCPDPVEGGERVRMLERDSQALVACFPAAMSGALPLQWDEMSEADRTLFLRYRAANVARRAWAEEEEALAGQVRHRLRDVPGAECPGWRVDFKQTKTGRPLVVRGGGKE